MANVEFSAKFNVLKSYLNRFAFPLCCVGLIAGLFVGRLLLTISVVILLLVFVVNCLWFVPTGTVGFKRVFGKLSQKSYTDGINWKVPFITDTYLLDTKVQTRDIIDTKKVVTRNNLKVEATLTYQLEELNAFLVYQLMGAAYYDTHLSKWVDAIFDNMVSKLTYAHFQAQKAEVESWASSLVASGVAKMCSDITEEAVRSGLTFDATDVVLKAVMVDEHDPATGALVTKPKLIPVATGEDSTELVPEFMLIENDVELPGVNLFRNVSLKINKVEFESQYEEARAKVAVAKAAVTEEEEKRKRTLVILETKNEVTRKSAEAEADAIRTKAEADAEALKLKGASENEVREKLGVILKNNPELIKEVLAKNFPKVFGGNGATPMINLDTLLSE